MNHRIVVTASARADALEAFRWLAKRSPDAAVRWYKGLQKAIGRLEQHPERHPIAEEESEQLGIAIRQMAFGRRRGVYRILFSIKEDSVILHYVRHSARGPIEP